MDPLTSLLVAWVFQPDYVGDFIAFTDLYEKFLTVFSFLKMSSKPRMFADNNFCVSSINGRVNLCPFYIPEVWQFTKTCRCDGQDPFGMFFPVFNNNQLGIHEFVTEG